MPKFTKKQVDKVFTDAEHQGDYMVGLYRLAYGDDWQRVKVVEEWPQVSHGLHTELFERAIRFDKQHHPEVLPGGAWLNSGFAAADNITQWGKVRLRATRWLAADEA